MGGACRNRAPLSTGTDRPEKLSTGPTLIEWAAIRSGADHHGRLREHPADAPSRLAQAALVGRVQRTRAGGVRYQAEVAALLELDFESLEELPELLELPEPESALLGESDFFSPEEDPPDELFAPASLRESVR